MLSPSIHSNFVRCGCLTLFTAEFRVHSPLLERIIELFDTDHDNTVSFQEFIKALSVFTAGTSKDDKLRFAFNVYDIDGDGYISNGELYMTLKQMSGTNLTEEQLQQVVDKTIMENDLNHDGKLSFEEFKKATASSDVAEKMTISF